MKKTLVFGATGLAGSQIVAESLKAEHQVTAYIRQETYPLQHQNLHIVKGNLADENAIQKAMEGQEVIVSAVGNMNLEDSTMVVTPLVKRILAKPIADWYLPWGNRAPYFAFRGTWENRITQMSELDIWGFDVGKIMKNLHTPTLMIHSDNAATGAEIPKKLFGTIPSENKKLVWFEEKQVQFQFYEESLTIDKAVFEITTWLQSK